MREDTKKQATKDTKMKELKEKMMKVAESLNLEGLIHKRNKRFYKRLQKGQANYDESLPNY